MPRSEINRLADFIVDLWCGATHGGGRIERDELGRINWRCVKCMRWSKSPVPLADERASTDAAIAAHRAKREATR